METKATDRQEGKSVGNQLSTLEILKRGRERVARGWCQGAYVDDGRYCTTGAIGGDHANFDAWCLLQKELSCGESITEWNDEKGRTQAEVVALFDRAIAKLTSEQGGGA